MEKEFSTHWKASKQPRKQVKYSEKAPLHIQRKFLGTSLSKELRKKHGRRSVPVRKNDVVKILVGKFKKKQGKVLSVNTKKQLISIEGMQIKKQDGSKINIMFRPSNVQIIELVLEDKKRLEVKNKQVKKEKTKEVKVQKEEKKSESIGKKPKGEKKNAP
jgi:large subunit ribosomal protein L24